MAKRWAKLTNKKQRAVLTDMLPFEVPPTFSNRGFYNFLKANGVEIDDGHLHWISSSTELDVTMSLLFGITDPDKIEETDLVEWGRSKKVKSISLKKCTIGTIPFNFNVAHHNLGSRALTVVHPRNQVDVAGFYAKHSSLILYHTSVSDFSIRHPVSVSRFSFFKDKLHEERLDKTWSGIEQEGREYKQLGSYFVYKTYRNIHGFFESYQYHRCEKKYDAMAQIDVSKCFDSIYTHSLPWAVLGKPQTKFNLEETKSTFAHKFDSLMQKLNHMETNGIVIGPEFSRIFAEIILQSIDVELHRRLKKSEKLTHKVDYEIFRYVDDYFVFYNQAETQSKILEHLQELLKAKKLAINPSKLKIYEKPIITEMTIAKTRASSLLNSEIAPCVEEKESSESEKGMVKRLACDVYTKRLIIKYKAIVKETGVDYGSLLNYTLAIVEKKIEKLLKAYLESDTDNRDQKRLIKALLAVMEFAFFAYAASPRVNHTIRICRMVSTFIDFLNSHGIPKELKHLLFKYVHDNIVMQLDKNKMTTYREVENLYLLTCLSKAGKEYWLPETTLAKHFLISVDDGHKYERKEYMNHFSITVLLTYVRSKKRYSNLRNFVESHVVEKLDYKKAHCQYDAESLMLLLDLIVCPYVSESTKQKLADVYGLSATDLSDVRSVNNHWFTAWGDKFDLGKELDAKRSREVY